MATKKTTAKAAPTIAHTPNLDEVTLSPANVPLLPGNTGTFTAREGKGFVEAEVVTNLDTWRGQVSNNSEGASVSKLIEGRHTGDVTVTFYEDGHAYASGSFAVEG